MLTRHGFHSAERGSIELLEDRPPAGGIAASHVLRACGLQPDEAFGDSGALDGQKHSTLEDAL
jgi:hypothetical protein